MISHKQSNSLNTPTNVQSHLYPRLGNLDLIKTLNYGITSKVKLARDNVTKKEYAVKIIKPEFQARYLSTLEQETKFLTLLSQEEHPNIVKLVECCPKGDYTKKNGTTKKVFALIFELAEGGDLFDCIKAVGGFQEDTARTYFHQLISTVEYLHNIGIIHGDLKLENLLLGSDFSLKIADFSFASFALDQNNTVLQRQRLVTTSSMAPEVFLGSEYNGQLADLFSCGVILFQMVVGQPPFEKANQQDPRYRLLIRGDFPMFWKQYETLNRIFTKDFKDLINDMLSPEPTQRLTISEVKSHDWFNGKVCLVEELKQEYEIKKQSFLDYHEHKAQDLKRIKESKAIKKKELDKVLSQPKLSNFHMKGIAPLKHRSLSMDIDREGKGTAGPQDIDQERRKREYVITEYRRLSEYFYDVSQDAMFKLILLLSNKIFNTFKVHPAEYKIKGRVSSDSGNYVGEMLIYITKVNEDSCCLSVTKISGSILLFYKFIDEKLTAAINTLLEKFTDFDI